MFALTVKLNKPGPVPDFSPTIVVDRAVQVEEIELDPAQDVDAELAAVPALLPAAAASSSSSRPSPFPRRSGGASPWLIPEEEEDDENGSQEGEAAGDDSGGEAAAAAAAGDDEGGYSAGGRLELAQANFLAGHNKGELLAGSIGFYRYEQPAGVFGLRPPPLRSNVVCIMAVPSWLSSSELLEFIGGYTRYARQMRLLRDASMPHRHMLLLQFASASIAERFRADYHAKRFNSLEPEVALAVHVAQVHFAQPDRRDASSSTDTVAEVGVRLHVTPLNLRLSRQTSPKDGSGAIVDVSEGGGGGGASSSSSVGAVGDTYQLAIDARLKELWELPPAERKAAAATEQLRQRVESRLINEAFAADELEAVLAAERCAACEVPPDTNGELSVQVGNGAALDGNPPVRLQLWVRDRKREKSRPPKPPSPPPLLPPTPEVASAVARANRGHRATLPALPDGALLEQLGGAVELPSCPVCLERLDPSISGVVTIVCDHTFHCECLRRWSDSSCPVCRHVSDDSQNTTACEVCGNVDNLWMCLVCGHVGCGRYSGCGAGVHHNENTDHSFAMELATQRVWDYKGDNYVHRLIQNKVDGKLVELPDPNTGASSALDGRPSNGMDPAAKEVQQRGLEEQYEAVVHEYSLLLTGQLEVQRLHYEERLAELDRAHKRRMWEAEAEMAAREDTVRRQHDAAERESKASAKRVQSAQKAVSEGDFNKQLNEQLIRNQGALRDQLSASERKNTELQAQVSDLESALRDMTFHLESMRMIQEEGGSAADLSGGSIEGLKTPAARGGKKKAKGSRS